MWQGYSLGEERASLSFEEAVTRDLGARVIFAEDHAGLRTVGRRCYSLCLSTPEREMAAFSNICWPVLLRARKSLVMGFSIPSKLWVISTPSYHNGLLLSSFFPFSYPLCQSLGRVEHCDVCRGFQYHLFCSSDSRLICNIKRTLSCVRHSSWLSLVRSTNSHQTCLSFI